MFWYSKPSKPKAYAVSVIKSKDKDSTTLQWIKVVSFKEPAIKRDSFNRPVGMVAEVIGPFRSEADCEEFCDCANSHPKLYQPQV